MDSKIRFAEERDIPALSEIWEVCFHDPPDYIRGFYHNNFEHLSVLVCCVSDRPVSMLHTLESAFVCGQERQDARFLYAGGTLPPYRSRGYYSALFERIKYLAKENGFAVFGKPVSHDLIPYYRTLGFEPDSYFRSVTVHPGRKTPLTVFPLTPEKYNRMRDRAFRNHPYAKWPDRHVEWCFADNEYFGGKSLAVELDGEIYFLMGAPKDNMLEITETDLSLEQLKQISGALCGIFGTDLLKANLPGFSCNEGDEIVSSIVYNAPLKSTYVNLILS